MPSDANRSTVTLTTFHAWNGRKWVEQPAPPVTETGPGWVREPLPPYSAVPACAHQWVYRPGLPGDILEYQCRLCQVWVDAKRLEFLQQTSISAPPAAPMDLRTPHDRLEARVEALEAENTRLTELTNALVDFVMQEADHYHNLDQIAAWVADHRRKTREQAGP